MSPSESILINDLRVFVRIIVIHVDLREGYDDIKRFVRDKINLYEVIDNAKLNRLLKSFIVKKTILSSFCFLSIRR